MCYDQVENRGPVDIDIQVYAPTDDEDGEIKDAFFEELQGAVDKVPRGDKLIVMGDLNARVGNKAELWKGVIGKHGEEVESDSGRRLLSFSAENEMQVMNTQYEHKRIHKFTWTCPGRGLKSIIDYFLVRGDLRKEVHDVKVIWGAEIGSDHHLVLMKVIICGRSKMKRKERSCQLRSERLRTKEGEMRFRARLGHLMYNAKHLTGKDVERAWEEFKGSVLGTAEAVCGRRKIRSDIKRIKWWKGDVEDAVRKKKGAYKRWIQVQTSESRDEYLRAKREARDAVRKAKNEEWVKLGESLQNDFSQNQRSFWARVRTSVKGRPEVGRVCDNNGQVICEEGEVRKRWRDYFATLLQSNDQPQQGVPRGDAYGAETGEEADEEITLEEVRNSIAKLKSKKAPGVCGVTGEMLKAGGEVTVRWMHSIVNVAWEAGSVPEDWRKALVIPVHKKGSKMQCTNYRSISLLSIPGKVYARILDYKVRDITEGKVLEEQGAFRKKRSCVDQMFTVRQLGDKIIEKNKRMVMVCVDLEKAYDRVDREMLWQVLESYGVGGRLGRAVKSLYERCQACVRVLGQNSDWFGVEHGVRQGCVMSP